MIWKHDASRAHSDVFRRARYMPDNDRGRRTGDAAEIVVLREPKSMVAPLLRVPRQIGRVPKSERRIAAFNNRRKIQNGIPQHDSTVTRRRVESRAESAGPLDEQNYPRRLAVVFSDDPTTVRPVSSLRFFRGNSPVASANQIHRQRCLSLPL